MKVEEMMTMVLGLKIDLEEVALERMIPEPVL